MRRGTSYWPILFLAFFLSFAFQGPQKLKVRVSYVSGRSLFLDKGSRDGIQVGDTLLIRFPGGPPLKLRILSVSESSSRARVPEGVQGASAGVSGEIRIPRERLQRLKEKAKAPRRARSHPPWKRELQRARPGEPLLAPVIARKASERPSRWDGRFRFYGLRTWDRDGGRATGFGLFRPGLSLRGRNPFRNGGELRMDAEVQRREVYLEDEPDTQDDRGRVNRLYYEKEGAFFSYRAGRFVSSHHPEIGVVDGAEVRVPLSRSQTMGVLLGGMPEATDALTTGRDLGMALYWLREVEDFRLRLAFEKTWHKGVPDRDLFVVSAERSFEGGPSIFFHSLFDHYGDLDQVKSKGFEWTEAMLRLRQEIAEGQTLSASFLHLKLPELKRFEFPGLAADRLRNFRSDRLTLSSDHELGDGFEARTRLDFWEDQDRDGVSLEAGLRSQDFLFEDGDVDLLIYRRTSSFFTGPGFRVRARKRMGEFDGSLSYEWAAYETRGTVSGGATLVDQSVEISVDYQPPAPWFASLFLERRFGDGRDSWSLGMFFQLRF